MIARETSNSTTCHSAYKRMLTSHGPHHSFCRIAYVLQITVAVSTKSCSAITASQKNKKHAQHNRSFMSKWSYIRYHFA